MREAPQALRRTELEGTLAMARRLNAVHISTILKEQGILRRMSVAVCAALKERLITTVGQLRTADIRDLTFRAGSGQQAIYQINSFLISLKLPIKNLVFTPNYKGTPTYWWGVSIYGIWDQNIKLSGTEEEARQIGMLKFNMKSWKKARARGVDVCKIKRDQCQVSNGGRGKTKKERMLSEYYTP